MADVRWSRVARRELRAVIHYVADGSISAARALRSRIDDATNRLSMYPHLGRVVPEFGDLSVRELVVGSYRLVYRVDEDSIVIVNLIHGSRDLRRHLPDGPWDIL